MNSVAIGEQPGGLVEPVARLPVTPRLDERHRVPKPRDGLPRIEIQRLAVLSQRGVRTACPPQEIGHREMCLDVIRLIAHRGREVRERLRGAAVGGHHHSQAVMRLRGRLVDPRAGAALTTASNCCSASFVSPVRYNAVPSLCCSDRCSVGFDVVSASPRRKNSAAVFHSFTSNARIPRNSYGEAALEQQIQLLQARIGHGQIAIAPLSDMRLGLVELTEPAIGGGQRRVQAFGVRIDPQGVLEIRHGRRIITPGDRRAAQASHHGHGARRECAAF